MYFLNILRNSGRIKAQNRYSGPPLWFKQLQRGKLSTKCSCYDRQMIVTWLVPDGFGSTSSGQQPGKLL
uniref:Uncharacterized protein n=1 Tax=Arundo donax TaxID=35708 RepID=A0A0A9AB98_ARUDO